jgi:hypothetical protein
VVTSIDTRLKTFFVFHSFLFSPIIKLGRGKNENKISKLFISKPKTKKNDVTDVYYSRLLLIKKTIFTTFDELKNTWSEVLMHGAG